MITLLHIIERAANFLEKCKIQRPRRSAEEVIADALGKKRLDLYLEFDRPLETSELDLCRVAIQRRGKGEPAAYIAGKVAFAGVTLEVNSAVLIPRPETEILVETMHNLKGVLWDVCTGSGAIAIALKKRFPDLRVIASDISEKALQVAQRNAKRNKVDIEFLLGDLLEPFEGECDYLVCNPPYVLPEEYGALSWEVRGFEPKEALLGGYAFYERLAKGRSSVKKKIWLEIGSGQGSKVKEIFQGGLVEKDWAGHERFFSLEM